LGRTAKEDELSQFNPAVAVDQKTGAVAFTWYDAGDDDPKNTKVALYGTVTPTGSSS